MQSESTGVNINHFVPQGGQLDMESKETIKENNHTSHDEHDLKAAGILASLDIFFTLFGLELGYLVFGAAETLSNTLQGKDTSIQEAVAAVNLAKNFINARGKKRHLINSMIELQSLQVV